MMKKIINIKTTVLSLVVLMTIGCESLDTVNNNNPNLARVLSQGTDLPAFLSGGYAAFWQGVTDVHPVNALNVTSDAIGMSWGNYAQRRMGEEPRGVYNNASSESADYKQLVNDPWFGLNSAGFVANSVINAINVDGVTIDNGGDQDKSLLAGAYFLRGISKGYLGLMFDKAFIVNDDTDVSQQLDFSSYKEMIDSGVEDLATSITTAGGDGGTFAHAFFNGVSLNSADFIKLAHSYSARLLAQWPRTAAENATVDWASVESHAAAGVDFNFAPIADGNLWVSYTRFMFHDTGQGQDTWALVDQRLVAAMSNDPSYPSRHPETVALGETALPNNGRTTSDDARFATDFIHIQDNDAARGVTTSPWFSLDRGEWHFSWYAHNRNLTEPAYSGDGSSSGPMPTFRVADNNTLQAEAMYMQGNEAGAAAIINAGERVTRGGLPPVPSSGTAILEAIKYERSIEIMNSAPFSQWLDRRRWNTRVAHRDVQPFNGLQIGAPAHLPVPADELGALGLPAYNFGGPGDPDGTVPQ